MVNNTHMDREPDIVRLANRIAAEGHAGQVDKSGVDYIRHPCRVAASLARYGPSYEAAGLLHDVLEDTLYTAEDLAAMGVPADVIEAVQLVTRRDDETYREFVERTLASRNVMALRLKLADLHDNMRAGVPEGMKQKRYVPVIATIEQLLAQMINPVGGHLT